MTISSIEDRKKIFAAIKEISNSMVRIESERDLIKDIVAITSEEFQLPKKIVNKMARTYYKQSFNQEQQDFSDFEEVYNAVTTVPTSS